ncbi:20675_t:CDS:2 [Gigaspora margarita]|uniref:20675_t:CDS:1 n=1 Tax=Gigaspora margarita TaxID=4874 RepID=A0ABM8VWF3_GIGMA|nr:20675_t:CDS:2 [Gigaspora margarita]
MSEERILFLQSEHARQYGQDSKLINLIKNIIKDYPHESVFREFLQNADDAGARTFRITVDERSTNQNESLISKGMKDWQGPAIWIYNDAMFNENDFNALLNIHEGGKRADPTKIGKFGIGFNSCFHFTDVPSFVSGKYIQFLDPHEKFLGKQRGLQINFLENEKFRHLFKDQLAPYIGVEGCRFDQKFEGTLFRLPLRINPSEICDEIFNTTKILNFLEKLKSSATSELLFFRNIESFEVMHIAAKSFPHQVVSKWKVNLSNITREIQIKRRYTDEQFISFRLNVEFHDGIQKTSNLWQVCIGGQKSVEPEELAKFAERHRMLPRGGVAALLPLIDESEKIKEEGRLYCYLPLPQLTYLPVHLNGNWALSSDRSTVLLNNDSLADMDKSKLSWNRHLLLKILPQLYVKLLEEIVDFANKNEIITYKQIVEYFWPLPRNEEKNISYVTEFGHEVLKNLPTDKPLFWSTTEDGSYVSLREGFFENDKFIIEILAEYSKVKSVQLPLDMINELKSAGIELAPVPAGMVRQNLRGINNLSTKYKYNQLIKLLVFILEDEDYEDLNDIYLIPLYNNQWGKFDKEFKQKYYLASREQQNLVPHIDSSNFVYDKYNEHSKLKMIFEHEKFHEKTNIKKFNATSLAYLLEYELIPEQKITNWDPESLTIPNKKWLNEIWKIILESNTSLELFSKYPILEVVRPKSELILLDSKNPLLELPKSDMSHVEKLVNILQNLGIRFTDRSWDSKLGDYILKWTPETVLKALGDALHRNIRPFTKLTKDEIKSIRHFIIENWNDFSSNNGTKVKSEFNNALRKLPVWPTAANGEKFKSPNDGLLPPKKIEILSPKSKCYPDKQFLKVKNDNYQKILEALNVPYVDLINYLKNHYTFPKEYDDNYFNFIKSILTSSNFHEIKNWIESKPVIPNRSNKKLKTARDLYDYKTYLFRITFEGTDRFLHDEFQNNSTYLNIIKGMGFKYQVNRQTFLECARAIQKQSQEQRYQQANDLIYRATTVVHYLYDNIDDLNYSDAEYEDLARISFIPAELSIETPYIEKAVKPNEFECLNLLCLPKYKNIVALFHSAVIPKPSSPILTKYKKFGKPNGNQILEHLRVVAFKLLKSKKWKNEEYLFKKMLDEIYNALNEECEDEDTFLEGPSFINGEKIFLNIYPNEDAFEESNWKAANELIVGVSLSEDGFVKPSLAKYKKLLEVAGSGTLKSGEDSDDDSSQDDQDVKVNQQGELLLKALQQSLKTGLSEPLNDVIFIVKDQKIAANRLVLASAADHFKHTFSIKYRDDWSQEQENERQFDILMDLLEASDYYNIINLKNETEKKLFEYVKLCNVDEVLDHASNYNADLLIKYCNKFIENNQSFL